MHEFEKWEADWAYLRGKYIVHIDTMLSNKVFVGPTARPTASLMNLGYSIARMIFFQRALQEVDQTWSQSPPVPTQAETRSERQSNHDESATSPSNLETPASRNRPAVVELRKRVMLDALACLLSYDQMPSASYGRLPVFYTVSIEYSVLLLSRLDELSLGESERRDALRALAKIKSDCSMLKFTPQTSIFVDRAVAAVMGDLALERGPQVESPRSHGSGASHNCLNGSRPLTRDQRVTEHEQPSVNLTFVGVDDAVDLETFFGGGHVDMFASQPLFDEDYNRI
ncbi:uncharacterized protein FTJAE_10896 [Fusarium tjaetaba]|uniref:Uncharacterized protein n=1 Tax=Fusarium tjaetaba TaxID=1567544 RepID=A0A8H5VHL5_9HYPO|nr:uncharacterized protein FTJAE_10896 [Fusarium tjaetaba]KAF5622578.1 hypothetical protein FTJAE_10896 [Fusarium tjaetaba]